MRRQAFLQRNRDLLGHGRLRSRSTVRTRRGRAAARFGTRPEILRRISIRETANQTTRGGARRTPFVGRVTNIVRIMRGAQHPLEFTVVDLQTARQLANSTEYHQHMATRSGASRGGTPRLHGLLTFGHGFGHFASLARQGKESRAFKRLGQPLLNRGIVVGQQGRQLLAQFGTQSTIPLLDLIRQNVRDETPRGGALRLLGS